jgi:hypothetical protein
MYPASSVPFAASNISRQGFSSKLSEIIRTFMLTEIPLLSKSEFHARILCLRDVSNAQELQVTLQRIAYFQQQVKALRTSETNPENYRFSVGGYLAELDRMNLDVRDYLWLHPTECLPTEKARALTGARQTQLSQVAA